VGIAGVAILAAELAPSIGIHRPSKGHSLGIAMIQNGADREQEIFRAALGFCAKGGCGEARNANQFRCGLRAPDISRSGRGSTAVRLTIAGASGRGK